LFSWFWTLYYFCQLYVNKRLNLGGGGGGLFNTKCVFCLSLQLLYKTCIILNRIKPDIFLNLHWSSCEVPVMFVRLKLNRKFFNRCSKNTTISNFMRIYPVVVPCGQTDRHEEANIRFFFHNFANAPKKDVQEMTLRSSEMWLHETRRVPADVSELIIIVSHLTTLQKPMTDLNCASLKQTRNPSKTSAQNPGITT